MRTKNKNVTQVDSDLFFISLFKIGRIELKISYKLVLDLHSHILKKKKKIDSSSRETCQKKRAFEMKFWAGTYRLLQKPASTLFISGIV